MSAPANETLNKYADVFKNGLRVKVYDAPPLLLKVGIEAAAPPRRKSFGAAFVDADPEDAVMTHPRGVPTRIKLLAEILQDIMDDVVGDP